MPSKRDTAGDHHRVIDPAEAEGSENNRAQERGHRKAKVRPMAKVGRVKVGKAFPIHEVYRGDPEERNISHERSSWLDSAGLRRGEESCWR